MTSYHLEEAQSLITKGDVDFVRIEVADLNGCSKGYFLDAHFFIANCETGFSMTKCLLAMNSNGPLVHDIGFAEDISYENMALYPDLSTFQVLPWLDKTASVLADARIHMENKESLLHECFPRTICRNLIERLWNSHDLRLFGSFEYEFYLLDSKTSERANNEVNAFSNHFLTYHEDIARDIMRNMRKIGIFPERFHTEYAQGQFELSQSPAFGLCCPDNAIRTKQLVKEVARKHGYKAIWMTKPFPNESGSSAHFNHSLWTKEGDNAFYDAQMKHGLSSLGRSWLAGLVHHSDALLALAATTPNCLERSRVGGFAPTNNAWGLDNRSLAFRIKNSGLKSVYMEVRLPGAATNPYLFEAACIIAGMDGLRNKMDLKGEPFQGEISSCEKLPDHVSPLPQTLSEALKCLKEREVFKKVLGEDFMKVYTGLKEYEDGLAEEHRAKGDLFNWYMDFFGERV